MNKNVMAATDPLKGKPKGFHASFHFSKWNIGRSGKDFRKKLLFVHTYRAVFLLLIRESCDGLPRQ